jgi:hypothetical protein
MNSLANESDTIPSTGRQDSVLIAYSDLKKVNGKLIELKYEKEINEHLRSIMHNDSIAIDGLRSRIISDERYYKKQIKEVKTQRNLVGGVGVISIILLFISIL